MAEFDPRKTDLTAFGKAVEQQLAKWTDEGGTYSTDSDDWWMDLQDQADHVVGTSLHSSLMKPRLVKLATYAAVLWSATKEEQHEAQA